jgi:hypothetical protein
MDTKGCCPASATAHQFLKLALLPAELLNSHPTLLALAGSRTPLFVHWHIARLQAKRGKWYRYTFEEVNEGSFPAGPILLSPRTSSCCCCRCHYGGLSAWG